MEVLFKTARRSIDTSSHMVNRSRRLRLGYRKLVAVSPSTLRPGLSYQMWPLSPPLLQNQRLLETLPSHPLRPDKPRPPIRARNRVLRGAWQVAQTIPPLPSIQPAIQGQGQGLLRSLGGCQPSPCRHSSPTNALDLTPLRLECRRRVPSGRTNPPAGDILSLARGSAEVTQRCRPRPQTTRMRAGGEVGPRPAHYIS